jgi:pimeloyl-[acyl-carrier protein] methyl ester esterase
MQFIYLHGFATNPQIWRLAGEGCAPRINFEDFDAESRKLAEAIVPGTVLIGWSMGGMMALQLMKVIPEKIRALVLVSTTPKFVKTHDFPHALPEVTLQRMEERVREQGIFAFHSIIFKRDEVIGLEDVPKEKALLELAELGRADMREGLERIKVPTLIIHGDLDRTCLPSAAKYMHEKIARSELAMLEGVGHVPMLEAPEQFHSLLNDFVAQNAG